MQIGSQYNYIRWAYLNTFLFGFFRKQLAMDAFFGMFKYGEAISFVACNKTKDWFKGESASNNCWHALGTKNWQGLY